MDKPESFFVPSVYGDSLSMFSEETAKVIFNSSFMEVENKYRPIDINNLVFVGNSLIEGLRLYSNSDNIFLCKIGISLNGLKSEIYNQIDNYSCETVVIEMGSNELGWYGEENFKQDYLSLINKIYSVNQKSRIICVSIPPVSINKSNSSTEFNNKNVLEYNQYIKEICVENNLSFIDCSSFFGDVLKSDWTGDGIHLKGQKYKEWYDYLINEINKL